MDLFFGSAGSCFLGKNGFMDNDIRGAIPKGLTVFW